MCHPSVTVAVMAAGSPSVGRDGRFTRWDAHRVGRRTELIEAAIDAVRRYGAAVGIDQIASVARTSKPVIYRYFTDRTELYRAVGQRVAQDMLRDLSEAVRAVADPRTRLHAGIDAYLRILERSPDLYRFVVGGADGVGGDFSASVAELLTAELAAVLRAAGLDPARAEPWGVATVGFLRAAGQWWLSHRDAMTRPELADYLSGVLWNGTSGFDTHRGLTPLSGLMYRPDTSSRSRERGGMLEIAVLGLLQREPDARLRAAQAARRRLLGAFRAFSYGSLYPTLAPAVRGRLDHRGGAAR